jgi:riboflavin synthase
VATCACWLKPASSTSSDVKLGDSIAVSGVCLTVVELPGNGFAADVSRETLDCTAMNDLKAGSPVNLEKALTPTTRLGGHLVSGHVDGVGEVVARERKRAGRGIPHPCAERTGQVHCPQRLDHRRWHQPDRERRKWRRIRTDHHSRTPSAKPSWPRTVPGRRVNLEVDLLARYLERLLLGEKAAEPAASNITESFLAANGYLKS